MPLRRWPVARGEVSCAVCLKPIPRAAAVRVGGFWLHAGPRCLGAGMKKIRQQLDLALGGK